jgi:Protein of unknown function (DUF3313)
MDAEGQRLSSEAELQRRSATMLATKLTLPWVHQHRVGLCAATAFAAALFAIVAAQGAFAAESPSATGEWDGLQREKAPNVDALFVAPEARFGEYTSVMIDPALVAFRKDWGRNVSRTVRIRQKDRDRIMQDVANEFHKVFTEELEKGGYQIVAGPAENVLRLSPAIVDLYVNAPDIPTAGRSESYVVSAGEMTLFVELRDSETGDLLARAVDRRRARENSFMRWATRVTNLAEARQLMRRWAVLLREALDAARAEERTDADQVQSGSVRESAAVRRLGTA